MIPAKLRNLLEDKDFLDKLDAASLRHTKGDRDAAQELTQETILQILEQSNKPKTQTAFMAEFWRVNYNIARTWQNERNKYIDATVEVTEQKECQDTDVENAINQLSNPILQAIARYKYQGYTDNQTAAFMNVSRQTIANRKKILKSELLKL